MLRNGIRADRQLPTPRDQRCAQPYAIAQNELQRGNSGLKKLAGTTGLEPAASAVTGQRSNQLNYVPAPERPGMVGSEGLEPSTSCL